MVATYKFEKTGRTYQLTGEDMLWAARMIVGEAGRGADKDDASAMLWAMMNRFMQYGNWYDYTELLRKFSQPINPIWYRDGKRCRPGGKYHGTKFCAENLLKRREEVSSLTGDEIPINIKTWVREFANGVLLMPVAWTRTTKPRINNWGAHWLKQENKQGQLVPIPELYPWGVRIGGEWFFEDPGTPGGVVTVESDNGPLPTWPTGFATMGSLSALLVGGALGGLGYLAFKHFSGN